MVSSSTVDRFTSKQDQNDHRTHIVEYMSPAKVLRYCDIYLSACQSLTYSSPQIPFDPYQYCNVVECLYFLRNEYSK